MLVLEDGQVGYGDCATGQYSGIGGRDKPFFSKEIKSYINKEIKPKLEGMELDNFRETASDVESWIIGGKRLHTGVVYGITQALLDGVAKIKKITMAEVIAEEYGTELAKERIPIFIQSGDDRYIGADKGIMKRAEVI
jgi:methylaspartate ammonia-lyase